ncbi:MAG: phosphatase PAP2 family protein [Clostridia bacterium]|nr:phosphatase PAP2 family protein [Clostridia bacterium]MBQ3056670.1 phosphatase PAP2 family protein [Clostridia bacterium]
MAEWIDAVFKNIDLSMFSFMHGLAVATGESVGAEITSWLTYLMKFISFFAHDGLCMFALGAILMLFRRTRKLGACVFIAVCCGGIITNLTLKPLIARMRPYANFDHLAETVHGWWVMVGEARKGEGVFSSFPSGHTTSATAAMLGLFLASKKKKYLFPVLLFPLLMGASRIYLMVHYTSDVLAGLVAGALGGIAAYFITKLIFKKLEAHGENRFCRFVLDFDLVEWIKQKLGKSEKAV